MAKYSGLEDLRGLKVFAGPLVDRGSNLLIFLKVRSQ